MPSDLTFTGERFLPSCSGEIAYEHWHRYAFARRFASGLDVLDAASGEGYGTALLGTVARTIVGLDIDADAVHQASARYAADQRIRFALGSCTQLPFSDATFDVIVSFETVEHIDAADQRRMLTEFARVLRPNGVLILSSPNKRLYSDARNYVNEFHRHELYRDELSTLVGHVLPAQRWYHQNVTSWSGIWVEDAANTGSKEDEPADRVEAWLGDSSSITPYVAQEGMYFVVIAGRTAAALPALGAHGSILTDRDASESRRSEANAREVMRLDTLLRARDAALDRQTGHVLHLESLVAERERIVDDINSRLIALNTVREQRDEQLRECTKRSAGLEAHVRILDDRTLEAERRSTQLASRLEACNTNGARLEAALTAQERIIAYRQSARWWVKLPWFRAKLWWDRTH